jgi:hypothetical protein
MWTLHTENEHYQPPISEDLIFGTKEEALRQALRLYRDPANIHIKSRYIKGPAGARMDANEIENWCRKHG